MSVTTSEQKAARLGPAARTTEASSWSKRKEWMIESLIKASGISAIALIGLIFAFLLREGLPAFGRVSLSGFLDGRWYPIEERFGLVPLLFGTLLVTVGAILMAVPMGLTTAVYLGEFAPAWQRDVLKPLIEILAGIPSIVLGFLGWIALAPLIQQLGANTGLTAFSGSLILAYMALPTIISVAEDALYAVPKEYRDGALAIGATRWQTTWRVVVPAAKGGIVTAVMLGIGRAIGETMAVMMVTGNAANIPDLAPDILFQPVRTMTATIAAEMGEVAQGSLHYSVLFTVGITLFVITFAINTVAALVVGGRSRRRGASL